MAPRRLPVSLATKLTAAAAVFAGLVVLYFARQRHLLANTDGAGQCKVLATAIDYNDADSKNAYAATVTVEHEVDGQTYVRTDEGPRTRDRMAAESQRLRFPVDSVVGCHYVKSDPALVTVFPGKESGALGLGLFGAFLATVLPALVYATDRLRAKRRA